MSSSQHTIKHHQYCGILARRITCVTVSLQKTSQILRKASYVLRKAQKQVLQSLFEKDHMCCGIFAKSITSTVNNQYCEVTARGITCIARSFREASQALRKAQYRVLRKFSDKDHIYCKIFSKSITSAAKSTTTSIAKIFREESHILRDLLNNLRRSRINPICSLVHKAPSRPPQHNHQHSDPHPCEIPEDNRTRHSPSGIQARPGVRSCTVHSYCVHQAYAEWAVLFRTRFVIQGHGAEDVRLWCKAV